MEHTRLPEVNEIWPTNGLEPKGQGSTNEKLIFISVGLALTKWEMVESQFGMLFKLLLESDSDAGARAYGILTSTTSRKDVLKQAGIIFNDRHKTEFSLENFNLLLRHYELGAKFRNHIAHGMVTGHFSGEKNLGYFLVPASYSSKGIEPKTGEFWTRLLSQQAEKDELAMLGYTYRYTHEDINSFSSLFEQLRIFAYHIWHEQFMLYIERMKLQSK